MEEKRYALNSKRILLIDIATILKQERISPLLRGVMVSYPYLKIDVLPLSRICMIKSRFRRASANPLYWFYRTYYEISKISFRNCILRIFPT